MVCLVDDARDILRNPSLEVSGLRSQALSKNVDDLARGIVDLVALRDDDCGWSIFVKGLIDFLNEGGNEVVGRGWLCEETSPVLEFEKVSVRLISTFQSDRFVFLGIVVEEKKLFLVQHLNSIIGAFCPVELWYFSVRRNQAEKDQALACWVRSYFTNVNQSLQYERGANSIRGVLVNTDPRPSHFFYEFLPALCCDSISEFIGMVGKVFFRPKTWYISVSEFLGLSLDESTIDEFSLQEYCFSENALVIQPGFRRIRGFCGFMEQCDARLSSAYGDFYRCESHLFPIVWLSVLSEKKAWAEQNAVIISIIKRFQKAFDHPLFVLDGLTASLEERDSFFSVRSSVNNIKGSLPSDINFLDLHGALAAQKVSIALQCHIFLTSNGTDSLYPARIAKKPGVVHCGPDISMFRKHRYSKKTVKLSPELARFLPGQERLRVDRRSYSVPQDVVENAFWRVWEGSVYDKISSDP